MPLTPGTRLGPYEIVAPLGAGGMGEVYRARDPRLGREVAIKVLPTAVAKDPERLARFEREARAVAGLNHPNIVVLHSIEDAGGVRFLTLELVEGESLDRRVVPGGLPIPRVIELGVALADALAAAHASGVVHRDLKPANVMITREGRVKVLDFGLAKAVTPVSASTSSQVATVTAPPSDGEHVTGTAPYMSPEQLRGESIDARSDLFSLGVLLYELATGKRPFAGTSFADVAASILRDEPVPVESVRTDVPADLARVVARCLEKDPERRIQTAKDVRLDLERAGSGGGAGASSAASGITPSIAILPFENRGRAEEDEVFADGITEDVIAQLSKVKTLKVISRTSVMAFKGHAEGLKEIATKLDVAHVLEGSVRRAGERVRIVAQLVDPSSGRTLWAETYDRMLDDVFAIQTDVALQIAGALRAELTPKERARIGREQTRDAQAYELYLYGRRYFLRFNAEDYRRSIEFFERAIERDPGFAPAFAVMSMAYTELLENGVADRKGGASFALDAAAKAVDLDPELSDAHLAMGYAQVAFNLDYARAEESFKRAIELSPGNALAYDIYGRMCAGVERYDEAVALMERAHELDPLVMRSDLATVFLRSGRPADAARVAERNVKLEPRDARLHATLGWALFRQGKVKEGLAELERAPALAPTENSWLAQLGEAYGLSGQAEKAHEVLRKLADPSRPFPVSSYHLAYVYTGLGDAERAIELLERSYEHGEGPAYAMKGSFLFESLRPHPRFQALLKRMGQA